MCNLSLPVDIVPTAPQNLNFMDFTNTGATLSVTLTWRRPDPPNGLITQYNVSDNTNSYYQESIIEKRVSYFNMPYQK